MSKLVTATFEIGRDPETQEVLEKTDLKSFRELADLLYEKRIEHLEINMGYGKFVWNFYPHTFTDE